MQKPTQGRLGFLTVSGVSYFLAILVKIFGYQNQFNSSFFLLDLPPFGAWISVICTASFKKEIATVGHIFFSVLLLMFLCFHGLLTRIYFLVKSKTSSTAGCLSYLYFVIDLSVVQKNEWYWKGFIFIISNGKAHCIAKILKVLLNRLPFHCVIPVHCDFLVCILTVIIVSIQLDLCPRSLGILHPPLLCPFCHFLHHYVHRSCTFKVLFSNEREYF